MLRSFILHSRRGRKRKSSESRQVRSQDKSRLCRLKSRICALAFWTAGAALPLLRGQATCRPSQSTARLRAAKAPAGLAHSKNSLSRTDFRHEPVSLAFLRILRSKADLKGKDMRCSRCGHDNKEGTKFCNECGSKLDTICASCSTPNLPGSKFCSECGTPLTRQSGVRGPESPPHSTSKNEQRLSLSSQTSRGFHFGQRRELSSEVLLWQNWDKERKAFHKCIRGRQLWTQQAQRWGINGFSLC